jgi:hypothetical protein
MANFTAANAQAVVDSGGAAAVVAAMRTHPGNAAVAEQGCRALLIMANFTAAGAQAVVDAGGAAAAVAAMRTHSGIAAVAEHGCATAANLAQWTAAAAQSLLSAGAAPLIVAAVKSHPNARHAAESCRAFYNLSKHHASLAEAVSSAGAKPVIEIAMLSYPEAKEWGERALASLAKAPSAVAQQALADRMAGLKVAATHEPAHVPAPASAPAATATADTAASALQRLAAVLASQPRPVVIASLKQQPGGTGGGCDATLEVTTSGGDTFGADVPASRVADVAAYLTAACKGRPPATGACVPASLHRSYTVR